MVEGTRCGPIASYTNLNTNLLSILFGKGNNYAKLTTYYRGIQTVICIPPIGSREEVQGYVSKFLLVEL